MRFSKKEWEEIVSALGKWLKDYPVPEAKLEVEIDGKVVRYTPVQLVERVRKRTKWGLKLIRHLKQNALKAGFTTIPEHLEAMRKEWESFSEEERQKCIQALQRLVPPRKK